MLRPEASVNGGHFCIFKKYNVGSFFFHSTPVSCTFIMCKGSCVMNNLILLYFQQSVVFCTKAFDRISDIQLILHWPNHFIAKEWVSFINTFFPRIFYSSRDFVCLSAQVGLGNISHDYIRREVSNKTHSVCFHAHYITKLEGGQD